MSESILELAAWYPFIPKAGAVPDLAKNILDMRIFVTLGTGDLNIFSSYSQGTAYLTATSPTTFTVSVERERMQGELGSSPKVETYSLTVYVGQYTGPGNGIGYVVCRSTPSTTTLSEPYEIHPNCLIFDQYPTEVGFLARGDVTSTDGQYDEHGRVDGATGHPGYDSMGTPSLENGYNVSVSGSDSSFTYTGTTGAGKGVWTVSPFVDIPEWNETPGRGLRSINGQTGAVMLEGSPSINLSVYEELANSGQQTIVVELQPSKTED